MTLNQTANIAASATELRKLPTTGFRHCQPLGWAALLMATAIASAQVTNVHVGTTATQAVITYSAPNDSPCTIDVREGGATGPLVPDVDPSLFPKSPVQDVVLANNDSRKVNLVSGQKRVFVVGKRTAEYALDGFRHSRALQTNTAHTFKISCGATLYTGQFTTMNAPLGASFNDPLPVDPQNPGTYAWPDFRWTDRNQWVVDPFTGVLLKQLDSPRDAAETQGYGAFAAASNVGSSTDWTNPSAVLADDNATATYSGTTQGFLFVDLGLSFLNSTVHNAQTSSPTSFVPTFNAYCSGADCATASADDRSIQYCLTIDGNNCSSDLLETALTPCTSNCTGANQRFATTANPQPILAEWFASNNGIPKIDVTDLSKRTGTINRTGAKVSLFYGDRFNLNWKPGATITITSNGTPTRYPIASVDDDQNLTLAGSPSGSDAYSPYVASNAGLLIRKKTSSGHQISIQYITYVYWTNASPNLEPAGDEDSYANCAPIEVVGPNGEMGVHCSVAGAFYWIGRNGTVNRLGRAEMYYNGNSDGWNRQGCLSGSFWDWKDANAVYCPATLLSGHTNLFKFVYSGGNTDIGDMRSDQEPVQCSGGNTPCWTITNLTAGQNALDLQMKAFGGTDWSDAGFRTNFISLFGRMGSANSLLFMARRDQNNDTMAFLFRYDLATATIAGGIPTWRHWPLRWAGMHGPENLNDPKYIQVSATYLRGSYTGIERVAGQGPYYSTIASGPVDNLGHVCPTRPSSSPIAASDWPTGNLCLTITVDGEPADPTPAQYVNGTISISGSTVTGTGTYWTSFVDGTQMTINGGSTYYRFTWGGLNNPNQGTLDAAPGNASNVPYILYLEPVNNPKTGNPSFGYLQDSEVRDIFCVTDQFACDPAYASNEFMRLILKDPANPNIWTLQRGFAGPTPVRTFKSLRANGWLTAYPDSCNFSPDDPCTEPRVLWNAADDPHALNANGNTIIQDSADKGCCHSARQNGVNVDVGTVCPNRAGQGNGIGCYFARFNSLPEALDAVNHPGYHVSNNPLFHQRAGVGVPNSVDSHPSHNQTSLLAAPNDLRWIGDARPFLGDPLLGNPQNPRGTLLGGSLYKFAASQVNKLNPRLFSAMAACGSNPLLDVSGPASVLTVGTADNYKYCVAKNAGECFSGSGAGELYVNCPQIRIAACGYQGIGNSDPDTRDICIGDMGAHALNITQVAVDKPDPDGLYSRRVTSAFSRYKWLNQFWNTKILPNGKFMLVWSTFFQGQRNSVLLVKLPPFPEPDGINRGDFIPYQMTVPTPQIPGVAVSNAVVQFGYDKNYYCTSRGEACVQGAAEDFAYQSENPAGVACPTGCTITVQAISQRVMYFQVLLRDSSNNVVGRMSPDAVAIK